MADEFTFNRRDFLKLVGIGVAGAAAGCGKAPTEKLIPYLVAPTDILPGVPYWYASTCQECPAGCGVLVKAREGRAIKIEGNRAHPVNQGAVCARGQASLQGLYDPDRVKSPMVREGGSWKPIAWDDALKRIGEKLGDAARGRKGITLLTGNVTGSLAALAAEWAAAAGATHLAWEPFAWESLREANQRTFGRAEIPAHDFARARMVVSFGADFLETWLSPMPQARGFAAMRGRPDAGRFVAVEPRLSLTGANADEWIAVRPGSEAAVALGMARVILTEGLGSASAGALGDLLVPYTPEAVAQSSDVPAERLVALAREFAKHRPSLAVGGGIAAQSEQAVALQAAVNALNWVAGNVGETVRFDRTMNLAGVQSFSELQRLIGAMGRGETEVLIVSGANPAYAAPPWAGFKTAMDKVPFKVALATSLDETAELCDLILPASHPIESLGDAEPARGVWSLQQPAMQRLPMFDSRPAGDALIAAARAAGTAGKLPEDWETYLKARWKTLQGRFGAGKEFEVFWRESLQKGGVWEDVATPQVRWTGAPSFAAPQIRGAGDLTLVLYASPALYDGRGANKPWLQELPDPTSKAVWNTWAEIHPETAARLGVTNGARVKVETESGSVETYAYVYGGVRRDVVAMPLGQGHTSYGRAAKDRGVNPLVLLPAAQDAASGAVAYLSSKARVSKLAPAPERPDLVLAQREKTQADREVARLIPIAALLAGGAAPGAERPAASADSDRDENAPAQRRLGRNTEPRALQPGETIPPQAVTAFVPERVVRGPRRIPVNSGSYANPNHRHRWAMAIDLNSCTGCSACVVACYAENNIPTVGPELMKRGREMAWLRIERYEEKLGDPKGAGGETDVRFLPMLCQQCTDAPCEVVCPVYATYHNPEGLNAQVYNRCVGTRYCSNNCPYKVRAFNWYDYSASEKVTFSFPEPLNWQLNPDVTVRSKGVMEKCTFCIQRILEGKGNARDENRPLHDGEIQPACAQSCPTEAIVFGDLLDPESKVSKLSSGERRYWALDELNTKPGITYLKKIGRGSGAA